MRRVALWKRFAVRGIPCLFLGAALAGCGGGQEGTIAMEAAASWERSLKSAERGVLPVDLPGTPETRSIVRLPGGAHAVAWVAGLDAYVTRYDSEGNPLGAAVKLPR